MFRYSKTLNPSNDATDDKSKNMSSFRSLLYDDRYLNDRFYNDRYYHDRLTSLNGRNYWNHHYWGDRYNHHWADRYNHHWDPYYNHRYYNLYTNQDGTLRFPKGSVVTATSKAPSTSETRLWFPAPYTPPIWSSAIKNADVKVVDAQPAPLKRSNSFVSVTESKNETRVNDSYDVKYDYKYEEAVDGKSIKNSSSKSMSKSCSDMDVPVNNVTYVFETDKEGDKHRHVTYVKHTHEDGQSLEGNLVKSSDTFLPSTRSVNVGPIFNGSSFGILSEHLTIRDVFHVAFQFKTTQQNGVLMSIVDRSTGDAFFIELYDSQLKATLFVDGEADSCWTDFNKPVLSNDIWSDVEVNIVNNRLTMTVRNEAFSKTHRFPFRRPIRGDLFVAGYPTTASPPFVCRSRDFFVGEMRNFYLNNDGVKWYGTPTHSYPRLRNWYL